MAGRGISIDILANVRDALKGTGDVEKALGDIESTLDDMARSGDDSTDKMSRGFRDLARKADDSADTIERSFKQSYRDIRNAADDTADDVVRSQRRMGEKSAEVGQEIRQNLGEGIANAARGDFASLSDTIGDTFGGITAGIGGIGFAAAGAAAAVGIDAIVAAFQLAEQERQKLEERAADLSNAYIEAGTNVLDAVTISGRAADILTNKDTRKEAEDLAKALGTDLQTAVRALAGDTNALAVANGIVKDSEEEYQNLMQKRGSDYKSLSAAENDRFDQLQKQADGVRNLNEVNGIANQTFATQQEVLKGLITDAEGATKQVDGLGNAVYTLPDGTQILIDAETGQASTDVSTFKGDLASIPGEVVSRVRFQADTSDIDYQIFRLRNTTLRIAGRITTANGQVIQ